VRTLSYISQQLDLYSHSASRTKDTCAKAQGARARSVARRAQRVRRCDRCSRTPTALAHGIHRVRSGAFLHGALLAFREHTCVSLCLSHDCDFFPRAFPQSRAAADQYASLLSTPVCVSLPRDCPILRPRAGLPLSSGGHATLRSRLASEPHAARDPPHTSGMLWAVECLRRDPSSALRACTYLHAAEYTHVSCSQDDRDALELWSGEDKRPPPLRQVGRVLPGRDQDCVGIARQDDQSLGFRCAEDIKIAPPWPKLTPVGLSVRQAGAAKREDRCPQRLAQVGRVFPGRDQDRFRIGGQNDQSLGFWCAGALKIAPPWPKLTPAGLSGRQAGAAEREDERP
jgi:hypothetical protein